MSSPTGLSQINDTIAAASDISTVEDANIASRAPNRKLFYLFETFIPEATPGL
jgi:hypothetical protein